MGMIVLEDIEVMARIGLLEEELYAPQDLTVSVEIEHSFDRISETDDLADGIDYREVIEFIREFWHEFSFFCPHFCPHKSGNKR